MILFLILASICATLLWFFASDQTHDEISPCVIVGGLLGLLLTVVFSAGFDIEQCFTSPESHTQYSSQSQEEMILSHNKQSRTDTLGFYELPFAVNQGDTTFFFVDKYGESQSVHADDCVIRTEDCIAPYLITREWEREVGWFWFPCDYYFSYEIRINDNTRIVRIDNGSGNRLEN